MNCPDSLQEASKVKLKFNEAHQAALYKVKPIDEHTFVSGDEDGTVKLWDLRKNEAVLDHKAFDDFVSDFHVDDACRLMVASSGEG